MKSFLVAAAVAILGSSLIAGDAAARSKRGSGAAGMAGMAAMAPLALTAGTALIGSSGYAADPMVPPYPHVPTYNEPVILPHVDVPVHMPIFAPTPFGVPASSVNYGG